MTTGYVSHSCVWQRLYTARLTSTTRRTTFSHLRSKQALSPPASVSERDTLSGRRPTREESPGEAQYACEVGTLNDVSTVTAAAERKGPRSPDEAAPPLRPSQPTDDGRRQPLGVDTPETASVPMPSDEEVRRRLDEMSGDGGEAGLELEDGRPVAMKRGVKANMFRVI